MRWCVEKPFGGISSSAARRSVQGAGCLIRSRDWVEVNIAQDDLQMLANLPLASSNNIVALLSSSVEEEDW